MILCLAERNGERVIMDKKTMEKGRRRLMLTPREKEILHFKEDGLTSKEIAKILDISIRTVDTHLEKVRLKFNCCNDVQSVAFSIRNNLL